MATDGSTVEGSASAELPRLHYKDDQYVIVRSEIQTADISIDVKHVVAFLPLTDSKREQYTLQYVSIDDESKDKPSAANTIFRSLSVAQPPSQLVRDHAFVNPAFWYSHKSEAGGPAILHVIVSPLSGGGHANDCFDNLVRPFLKSLRLEEHKDYQVHHTTSPHSITTFTQVHLLPQANAGSAQTVLLLTGDGGIVDIVNILAAADRSANYTLPRIGLIPMGTGNALANSSRILADRTLGLSSLARGSAQPLPHFLVHFSPAPTTPSEPDIKHDSTVAGAVVFSWGLHAALVADSDTPEYRKHGAARFQMAAKENLFPADGQAPHEYHAKLSVLPSGGDEATGWREVERSEHAYVLVTFMAQLEAGFTISPASRPLDGKLRVVHFGPTESGGQGVMKLMEMAYKGGKHVEEDEVSYEEVDGVRLDFANGETDQRWRRVCVDGKIFVVGEGGSVEVRKAPEPVLNLICMDGER